MFTCLKNDIKKLKTVFIFNFRQILYDPNMSELKASLKLDFKVFLNKINKINEIFIKFQVFLIFL